jgi:hypothetical protein
VAVVADVAAAVAAADHEDAGEHVGADVDAGVHVDVIDALGWCAFTRRSATLDGSVPLRVAHACVPLLEGNSHGLQLSLRAPLLVQRGLVTASASLGDAGEALTALWRGALPRLVDDGLLSPGWQRELARGLVVPRGRSSVRLWTGLLVRPRAGLWVRVGKGSNRRALSYTVGEVVVVDPGGFVPLLLDVVLASSATRAVVGDECATLGVLRPGLAIARAPLSAHVDVGRAHLAFYDDAYFAQKKGQPTRKYRRTIVRPDVEPAASVHDGGAVVVEAGPCAATIAPLSSSARVALPDVESDRVPAHLGQLDVVTFDNMVPLSVSGDGLRWNVVADSRRLEAHAAAIRATWRAALGDAVETYSKGALLYLTKYVSQHPPGEPHFFVKPFALTKTPPGWSCLLEGVDGDGDDGPYDVWRGVVRTDAFHATPAVFHLWRPGASFVVPEGRPLLRAIPLPRSLQAPRVDLRFLDGVGPLSSSEAADDDARQGRASKEHRQGP